LNRLAEQDFKQALLSRMHNDSSGRGPQVLFGFLTGLVLLSFAGCYKRSGEAVVTGKEHIAAMEIRETLKDEQAAGPNRSAPHEDEKATGQDEQEITVDQYVMSPDVRGTGRDPRATNHEQWIVKVRIIEGGRQFNVQVDQSQWEKVKIGDRVKVAYREGKYTGTVWDAEIQ
jgi:hypothetical protein